MRSVRVAAAATSLLLLGAVTSLGSAGAAASGVGTSTAGTTVLHLALGNSGSLLDLKLLGDSAQSTIDSKTAAAPTAYSKLSPLNVASSLGVNYAADSVETRQPGGTSEKTVTSVDLSNPGGVVPAAVPKMVSGGLNLATLKSTADATSAVSSLSASLLDLNVAGGLLDSKAVSSTLNSASNSTSSTGTRSVKVDAITVLDLGALLDGLDITLSSLTPSEVSGLIDKLDIDLDGVDPNATLQETIDAIQAEVNTLIEAIDTGTGLISGTAGDVVDTLNLGDVIDPSVVSGITGTAVEQTNALIEALQGAIADILASALSALDATPLLKLNGVEVGVTSKAADTLANSVADVTGKIDSVTVGSQTLEGVDLLDAAATFDSTVKGIQDTIDGVLGSIEVPVVGSPIPNETVDLSKLVTITPLKKTKDLKTVNGYNTATAGITALSVTITPPEKLASLVTGIKTQVIDGVDIGSVIKDNGGAVPGLNDAFTQFENALGTGIQAAQGGGTVDVVDVLGTSEFRSVTSNTTGGGGGGGTLPATGANSLRLTAIGLLLVALGLGLGAWFDMPVPEFVQGYRVRRDRRPWIRRPL